MVGAVVVSAVVREATAPKAWGVWQPVPDQITRRLGRRGRMPSAHGQAAASIGLRRLTRCYACHAWHCGAYASDVVSRLWTLGSGTLRARVLRLQVAGTGRPSAGFVASTARLIRVIRTAALTATYYGHHGPERQPRDADGQLTPAHHGRTT